MAGVGDEVDPQPFDPPDLRQVAQRDEDRLDISVRR